MTAEQGAAGLDIAAYLPTWTAPPAETDLPEMADLIGGLHPTTDRALEEPAVTTETTETTERPTKPIADVEAGDVIIWSDRVVRVAHVEHYTAADDIIPRVLLVGRGTDGRLWVPNFERDEPPIALATPEEIAEAEATGHRAKVVAGLRELADLIERESLPVPKWGISTNSVLDSEADLRRWAEVTGWRVTEPTERVPYVQVDAPGDRTVSVHWQVSKPAVVVVDATEAGAL